MAVATPLIHKLKIIPEFFEKVVSGEKNFECRYNDRDFKVGDFLLLLEWSNELPGYTGKYIFKKVDYILTDTFQGLRSGYVIMSLKECDQEIEFSDCMDEELQPVQCEKVKSCAACQYWIKENYNPNK